LRIITALDEHLDDRAESMASFFTAAELITKCPPTILVNG